MPSSRDYCDGYFSDYVYKDMVMKTIAEIREEFLEVSVPVGASQEQINDMGAAFDAGAVTTFTLVLEMTELPDEEGEKALSKLKNEIMATAKFHAAGE